MVTSEKNMKKDIDIKRINKSSIDLPELEHKFFAKLLNVEDIINYISTNLLSIIQNNKRMKKKASKDINEPLYSKFIPVLSLEKYLIRIIKYTEVENNTLIVAFLYIIKLIKNENFILSINNIYHLLLGSVVLAKKVLEDLKYNNSYYCEIGGISLQEFNKIEFSLFVRLNYEVNPKTEEIENVYKNIIDSLPQSKYRQYYYKL